MADTDTTKDLTQVLSTGRVSKKAVELEDQFATRMEDGAKGIADAELGDAGPYSDDQQEVLPADIRADQVVEEELDTNADLDLTESEERPDLGHLDGNFRGEGTAQFGGNREGGEQAAPVADERQYRPEGPVTAAPTRKH